MRSDIFNINVDVLLKNFELGSKNFVYFISHYVSISKPDRFIKYPQQLLMGIYQNDILMPHLKFQESYLPKIIYEELKIFKKTLDKNGT